MLGKQCCCSYKTVVSLKLCKKGAGHVVATGVWWQRCYVHFLRNALDYLPHKADDDGCVTFDRRRSELRLGACADSIYLGATMTVNTNLQNLTHTTL